MLNLKDKKLPLIKNKLSSPKNAHHLEKIHKPKHKKHPCSTDRCQRKLSLKQQEQFKRQKRTLSQKRFSLKKIPSLKNLKEVEANTDDNSQRQKNYQNIKKKDHKEQNSRSTVFKAINLLKGMKEIQKIAKLYKNPQQLRRSPENNQESKKILKNKYKCLVNPHVFVRKPKHNKSDEAEVTTKRQKRKNNSDFTIDFWDRVDESLIIQTVRYQQPSKQLMELVENIFTQF